MTTLSLCADRFTNRSRSAVKFD